jgi:hypothetical protein
VTCEGTDERRSKLVGGARHRLPTVVGVKVTFTKMVEKRVTTWTAVRGKRTVVPGTTMALGRGGMPHDLEQFVVEAVVGLEHGFWGAVADGATFRSLGRKRTRPGRDVIRRYKVEIELSEHIVHDHVDRWRAGRPTPCADRLTEFDARWRALPDRGSLTVVWPTLEVLDAPAAVA